MARPPGTLGKAGFGIFLQAGTLTQANPGPLARPLGIFGCRQSLGHWPRVRVPPSSAVKRQSLAAKRRPPKAANPSAAGENFLMYPLLFSFWALYPFCAVGRVWSIAQVTHMPTSGVLRAPYFARPAGRVPPPSSGRSRPPPVKRQPLPLMPLWGEHCGEQTVPSRLRIHTVTQCA